MTTRQFLLMDGAYFVALVAVAWFTRAAARRIVGACAGGAFAGLLALGAIAICEHLGWWRIPSSQTPFFQLHLYLGLVISCSPIYLVTWRVARRFGWRGLAVFAAAATAIGPVRDYRVAAMFPEWISYAPGMGPALAIAGAYLLLVVGGHAMMRLVAGPARADPL